MIRIGAHIKKLRELRSFTQEYMAHQLGMTQAGYSKLENDITYSKIEKIAAKLKVTPSEIVFFDELHYFNVNIV